MRASLLLLNMLVVETHSEYYSRQGVYCGPVTVIQEGEPVTLSVRVGAKDIPKWWEENKATMIVSEGLPGSHYNLSSGHDPESCPFCRWKWKVENASAFIEFKDLQGKIIPHDCRTLFGLKENAHLLINGRGRLNEQGFLELTAEGIFINPA